MSYLSTKEQDEILIVTLDQPDSKVNKLDEQLITEFKELLETASQSAAKGIVLISGKENNFIAGADVEMLKNKQAPEEVTELSRRGNDLLLELEHFDKPIVAAIHGSCLGGGLEVAMACHYRVASDHDKTIMGQPESQLGLLTGGGGTPRLPRLIGVEKALPDLRTDQNVYPGKAYKIARVDEMVHKAG